MSEKVSADWTAAEAWAAEERNIARIGYQAEDGPYSQWVALQNLKTLHARYEEGEPMALMDAIAQCAMASLPMPDWVQADFLRAYSEVKYLKVSGWDEVLGKPLAKGQQLHNSRFDLRQRYYVESRIEDARRQGVSINEELFETVAKEFGISVTRCKKLLKQSRDSRKQQLLY